MLRVALLCFVVLLLAAANLAEGSVSLPWNEVWRALIDGESSETTRFIVLRHRLPQLLTALLSGAALGGGGLAMQTLFRNPLADPSLLGITSGAGLGTAVALLLFGGVVGVGGMAVSGFLLTVVSSFVGAMGVMVLLVWVSRRVRGSARLLIVGVMLSFIATSAVSLLVFFSTTEGVRSYLLWGMGDFSALGGGRLPFFAALLAPAFAGLTLLVKPLDCLLLGEDYTRSLGINVRRTRMILLLSVGWLSAVVTAVCGPIAFIGLAAPHMGRLLFRTASHRVLLPGSLLLGAATALFCLFVSQLPGNRGTLPLNAITPLPGAPIVLMLIMKMR